MYVRFVATPAGIHRLCRTNLVSTIVCLFDQHLGLVSWSLAPFRFTRHFPTLVPIKPRQ
jgi:hypothetical protein